MLDKHQSKVGKYTFMAFYSDLQDGHEQTDPQTLTPQHTHSKYGRRGSAGALYACTELHSCKCLPTPDYSMVRYSTVRYGTEELPGPALLLPDTVARDRKEREKKSITSFSNCI